MTLVRIHNATGHDLDIVRVRPPLPGAAPVDYGPLQDDDTSDYREIPDARAIAAIQASGPGADLMLQPYDVVGEDQLGPGRFTYRLSTLAERLQLQVIADD